MPGFALESFQKIVVKTMQTLSTGKTKDTPRIFNLASYGHTFVTTQEGD